MRLALATLLLALPAAAQAPAAPVPPADARDLVKRERYWLADCDGRPCWVYLVDHSTFVDQCSDADINRDGKVDTRDFIILSQNFGQKCEEPTDEL